MKSPALVLAALTSLALADQRGDTPDTQPSTPQEQLAKFHVPPGFEVQLVAAEPEIQKPINLNFDAAGRLWVTGSEMYPWPASTDVNGRPIPDFAQGWQGIVDSFKVGDAPPPSPDAKDTVRILSDFAPDGRARKITIFADRLNIPSGIQPLPRRPSSSSISSSSSTSPPKTRGAAGKEKDGDEEKDKEPRGDTAIVYSIPHIWLLTDMDGDGFAEKREPLYTGFGYTDTHGGASSFIHWIDGWIYGTHGFKNHSEVRDRTGRVTILDSGNTFRFRPDGTAFEIFAHGQTNPFGLAFDPLGNLFSADSHSKPVMMLLRGGYYQGIGKNHDGLGFAPTITDDDHGSSAIAGIAYYADDKWPAEYHGNLFNGNPVTRRLNRDRLEWHGSTPRAIRMPDFLTCDDPWFRPVNLKLGPDGALYIADFYNPIIGHYEVPLTHPRRDRSHGRIWRVVYRGNVPGDQKQAASTVPQPQLPSLQPDLGALQPHPAAVPPRIGSVQAGLGTVQSTSGPVQRPFGVLQSSFGVVQLNTPALQSTAEVFPLRKELLQLRDGLVQLRMGVVQSNTRLLQSRTGVLQLRPDLLQLRPNLLQLRPPTAQLRADGLQSGPDTLQTSAERLQWVSEVPQNASEAVKTALEFAQNLPEPPQPSLPTPQTPSPGVQKPAAGEKLLPVTELPDLSRIDAAGLVEKLADPNLEVRRLATNELVDRVGKESIKTLLQSLSDTTKQLKRRALETGKDAVTLGLRPQDDVAWQQVDGNPLLTEAEQYGRVHSLWALARQGGIAESEFKAMILYAPFVVNLHAMRQAVELARAGKFHQPEVFAWDVARLDWSRGAAVDPQITRACLDALREYALSPSDGMQEWGRLGLDLWDGIPNDDSALLYACKITVRDDLSISRIFVNYERSARTKPQMAEHLAEVCLALPFADSATFLLAHLERTKLETPRAGEYLKHAVLHLPAEKLDAVVNLLGTVGDAPLPQRLALAANLTEGAKQRGGALPAELTAWPQGVLLEALASSDNALAKRAIDAVRDEKFPAKLDALAAIVRDEKRDGALRYSALGAASNLPESRELFTATFADSKNPTLRKRAAELLAQNGETAAVLAALPQAPWELAIAIATGLAKTDAGATALLDAVEAGQAPARVLLNKAVVAGFLARPKALQERGKALVKDLPPEDARLDRVIAERAKSFHPEKANAYNGSAVFQKHCAVCHRFRNVSHGNVGPNLDGMAARGAQRLIEDILDPNRNLDPAFRQTIIETQDGQTLAGANLREQSDALQLTDATGKELSVAKPNVKSRTTLNLSLMPPAFEATLTPAEFNDLLAYLLTPMR